MLELIEPTTDLYAAFLDCRADWGVGVHEDGFGIDERDEVESPDGFATWVSGMLRQVHPAAQLCPDQPHWAPRWILEDGQLLGAVALRHHYDDLLGWIGYGVRPSARRRGVASLALAKVLEEARDVLGLGRALITCAEDNIASARTIEHCGGILDETRATTIGLQRRYWIDLT